MRACWALDAPDPAGRTGVWHLETILPGHGGPIATPTANALPSIAERTRAALFFEPATGALVGEPPPANLRRAAPPPEVLVSQERCWSDDVQLEIFEVGWMGFRIDAVDRSKRVGLQRCFGEPPPRGAASKPDEPETTAAAVMNAADDEEDGEKWSWQLVLRGGVEVRGRGGLVLHRLTYPDAVITVDPRGRVDCFKGR